MGEKLTGSVKDGQAWAGRILEPHGRGEPEKAGCSFHQRMSWAAQPVWLSG